MLVSLVIQPFAVMDKSGCVEVGPVDPKLIYNALTKS